MVTQTVERKAYSIAEAAKTLGVSVPTLYRWMNAGVIRYVKPQMGRVLIPATEIDRLLSEFVEPGHER